jgi:hypothetical protein
MERNEGHLLWLETAEQDKVYETQEKGSKGHCEG